MSDFEEIEHTADWAFHVRGGDLPDLFAKAARAMFALDGEAAEGEGVSREIQVEGVDRETLLINWLNELLFSSQTKHELYDEFDMVEMSDTRLRARVAGRARDKAGTHIKAATFHNLRITPTPEGWEATVVLDV